MMSNAVYKKFKVGRIFNCETTKALDINSAYKGNYPYITRTGSKNGLSGFYGNEELLNKGNCITIGAEGMLAFYQPDSFIAGVKVYTLRSEYLNELNAMYFVTLLNNLAYLYNYGRARTLDRIKEEEVSLPIKLSNNNSIAVDKNNEFSDEGYIPDWNSIGKYIKSLNRISISTNIGRSLICLNKNLWKEFKLTDIFDAVMGNGLDAVSTTTHNPKYNYVSRDSTGNGVVDVVDEITDIAPFPPGTLTLALGGSYLGACFIQNSYYYTAQNVGVLIPKKNLSIFSKLFLATLISNECRVKYCGFGRELNSHFRKDFSFKLPVLLDDNGFTIIDNSYQFSNKGFIPDWKFMEDYMKSLPNGDLI